MLFLALFACDAGTDTGSGFDTTGQCFAGPTIAITSPESSSKLPVGQPVTITAEATSEVDSEAALRIIIAVAPNGGNTDNLGTQLTETWTPTEVGIYTIFAQVEDSCTDELGMDPVQDTVRVEVE